MIVTHARTGSPRRVSPNGKRDVVVRRRGRTATRRVVGRLLERASAASARAACRRRRRPVPERVEQRLPLPAARRSPATATTGSRPVSLAQHAELAEARVELLLGLLAHAAGVDDDDVGVAVVRACARSRPLRAGRPSARSRGSSSGSRTFRSGICGSRSHLSPGDFRFRLLPSLRFRLAAIVLGDQHLAGAGQHARRDGSCPAIMRASLLLPRSPASSACTAVDGASAAGRPCSIRKCVVAARGDLRQVRDAEHLIRRPPAPAACRPTTSAVWPPMPASTSSKMSVRAGPFCADDSVLSASITRDSSPPETIRASGREILAWIRRHEELRDDRVPLGRPRLRRSGAVFEAHLETRPLHRELGAGCAPAPSRTGAAASPRLAESASARVQIVRARARRSSPVDVRRALVCRASVASSRSHASCVRDHVVQRRTVLPLQPLEQRQAILDLLQPPGRRIDAVGVVAEEERQVLELRLDGVARLEVRRRARVERGELADPLPDGGRAAPARPRPARRAPAYASALSRCSCSAFASTCRSAVERLVLARAQRRLLNLVALKRQQVDARGFCRSSSRSVSQLGAERAARARRRAATSSRAVVEPGERVEQIEMASDRAAPDARAARAARPGAPTRSRSAPAVASAPLTKARLRPCAVISRRTITSSPPSSKMRLDRRDVFARAERDRSTRGRRAAGRRLRRGWTCRRRFRRSGR